MGWGEDVFGVHARQSTPRPPIVKPTIRRSEFHWVDRNILGRKIFPSQIFLSVSGALRPPSGSRFPCHPEQARQQEQASRAGLGHELVRGQGGVGDPDLVDQTRNKEDRRQAFRSAELASAALQNGVADEEVVLNLGDNRRKRTEHRFSLPYPFPLFAPVPSSLARARECLLAWARVSVNCFSVLLIAGSIVVACSHRGQVAIFGEI